MNEKDFNRAVLSQLYEISAQVFGERVTVHRDGKEVEDEQFTASEIVNGKDSIGREIEILLKGEPGDVFTVEIDGFKCSFSAEGVFNIVAKFEKLAGISSKKRMKYLKGSCACEHIVNERDMYKSCSGGVITRKKKLVKLSERTAFCFNKKYYTPYDIFYKCGSMWYFVSGCESEEQARERCGTIEDGKWLYKQLKAYDFGYFSETVNGIIYAALWEALKAEGGTEEEAGTVQNEDKQEERTGQMDEQANEPNERQDRYKGIHAGIKGPDGFANTISHYETDVVKTRPNNRAYVGYLATFGIIRNRGST